MRHVLMYFLKATSDLDRESAAVKVQRCSETSISAFSFEEELIKW